MSRDLKLGGMNGQTMAFHSKFNFNFNFKLTLFTKNQNDKICCFRIKRSLMVLLYGHDKPFAANSQLPKNLVFPNLSLCAHLSCPRCLTGSLILYAYLFWYLLIMISFGADNMTLAGWENGIHTSLFTPMCHHLPLNTAMVLALFVFFALNAAAFEPPIRGYLRNYFKMIRFYMIPFCVSSISVACNASKRECMLLFPTDQALLALLLAVMAGIVGVGSVIHYAVLPRCSCYEHKHNHNAERPPSDGNKDQTGVLVNGQGVSI